MFACRSFFWVQSRSKSRDSWLSGAILLAICDVRLASFAPAVWMLAAIIRAHDIHDLRGGATLCAAALSLFRSFHGTLASSGCVVPAMGAAHVQFLSTVGEQLLQSRHLGVPCALGWLYMPRWPMFRSGLGLEVGSACIPFGHAGVRLGAHGGPYSTKRLRPSVASRDPSCASVLSLCCLCTGVHGTCLHQLLI